MKEKPYYEQTAMLKSEFLETISQMFLQDFGKQVTISELHTIKQGDGNTLFYVITQENYKFLVDLTGVKGNDLIYWIESIDFAGKITDVFYTQDQIITVFSRGENYNNEYLVYFYIYGNKYPAVRFIPSEMYDKYIKLLSSKYIKHEIKFLPEHIFKKNES